MWRALLVCSLVFPAGTQGLDCTSELPALPEFFSASLQWNVNGREKSTRACSNGGCSTFPGIEVDEGPIVGQSIALEEAVDNRIQSAYMVAREEFQIERTTKENRGSEIRPIMITEKIIWNANLLGNTTFLSHVMFGDELEFCKAESIRQNGSLDFIFGVFCKGQDGACITPSVASMLHASACWQKTGDPTTFRGVDVIVYKAILEDGTQMTYYWSDNEKWVSTSGKGRSVPIAARLQMIDPDIPDKEMLIEIDYQNFFEVELNPSVFQGPENLYCEGRDFNAPIPNRFPRDFNFGSEIVLVHRVEGLPPRNIISTRHEWFDISLNLSRVDYKPINMQFSSHRPENSGIVSAIMDFNEGIQYIIDQDLGNCTVERISVFTPGDAMIDEHGHLVMQSPAHFFHTDKRYSYNGVFDERGMNMDVYVTQENPRPDDPNMNETILVYNPVWNRLIVDEGKGDSQLPAKLIIFPTEKLMDFNERMTYNIFHFSKTGGSPTEFDITSCFKQKQKMRLSISFPFQNEVDLTSDVRLFIFLATFKISEEGKIAFIRVNRLETIVVENDGIFELVFTVVDPPPELAGVTVPDNYKTTLQEVRANLETSVDQGSFVISLNNHTFKGMEGSLKEVDSANGGKPDNLVKHPAHVEYARGYTSGAMAGLAFGMIFLGLLVAGSGYVFFFRNNVRAGRPVMRGFDNPLSGLSNLVK